MFKASSTLLFFVLGTYMEYKARARTSTSMSSLLVRPAWGQKWGGMSLLYIARPSATTLVASAALNHQVEPYCSFWLELCRGFIPAHRAQNFHALQQTGSTSLRNSPAGACVARHIQEVGCDSKSAGRDTTQPHSHV